MARKSRTQPKQSPDTLNVLSKVYKTAIYVRLSAEKEETRDRKTLINQRNLIKNFVDQQLDMEIYDIYMDMYNRRLIQYPAHGRVEKRLK